VCSLFSCFQDAWQRRPACFGFVFYLFIFIVIHTLLLTRWTRFTRESIGESSIQLPQSHIRAHPKTSKNNQPHHHSQRAQSHPSLIINDHQNHRLQAREVMYLVTTANGQHHKLKRVAPLRNPLSLPRILLTAGLREAVTHPNQGQQNQADIPSTRCMKNRCMITGFTA
jgi:hypothetical protein